MTQLKLADVLLKHKSVNAVKIIGTCKQITDFNTNNKKMAHCAVIGK